MQVSLERIPYDFSDGRDVNIGPGDGDSSPITCWLELDSMLSGYGDRCRQETNHHLEQYVLTKISDALILSSGHRVWL